MLMNHFPNQRSQPVSISDGTIQLTLENLLSIKHISTDHKLNKLLNQCLARRGYEAIDPQSDNYFWGPEFHGFDKLKYFQQANFDTKQNILMSLSNSYLVEACFIERFGFGFSAKIMTLADTVEEKSIYALFVADEAKHFRDVSQFVKFPLTDMYKEDPYIVLLAEIIRHGDQQSLIFILQSLLEGYGVSHYKHLHAGCKNTAYKQCLQRILVDEAQHYAAGCALVDHTKMTSQTHEFIFEMICELARLLQWPHRGLLCMEQHLGGLSQRQKRHILDTLGYQQEMMQKLRRFHKLIAETAPSNLLNRLEKINLFEPLGYEYFLSK